MWEFLLIELVTYYYYFYIRFHYLDTFTFILMNDIKSDV
jgi:hypothetical protein